MRKYGLPPLAGVTLSITTRPPWRISSTLSASCTGMRTAGSSGPSSGGGGGGSASGSSFACAMALAAAHVNMNTAIGRMAAILLKVAAQNSAIMRAELHLPSAVLSLHRVGERSRKDVVAGRRLVLPVPRVSRAAGAEEPQDR